MTTTLYMRFDLIHFFCRSFFLRGLGNIEEIPVQNDDVAGKAEKRSAGNVTKTFADISFRNGYQIFSTNNV